MSSSFRQTTEHLQVVEVLESEFPIRLQLQMMLKGGDPESTVPGEIQIGVSEKLSFGDKL